MQHQGRLGAIASQHTNINPENTGSFQQSLAEATQIKSAPLQLSQGTSEINKYYLEDRFFLRYWEQSCNICKKVIAVPQGKDTDDEYWLRIESWKAILRTFVQVGADIRVPLLNAARRGLLSNEILSVIGERMDIIDHVAEYFQVIHGDSAPTETW